MPSITEHAPSTVSSKQVAGVGVLGAFGALALVYCLATIDWLSRIQFLWSLRSDGVSLVQDLGPSRATVVGVGLLVVCGAVWMGLYLFNYRRARLVGVAVALTIVGEVVGGTMVFAAVGVRAHVVRNRHPIVIPRHKHVTPTHTPAHHSAARSNGVGTAKPVSDTGLPAANQAPVRYVKVPGSARAGRSRTKARSSEKLAAASTVSQSSSSSDGSGSATATATGKASGTSSATASGSNTSQSSASVDSSSTISTSSTTVMSTPTGSTTATSSATSTNSSGATVTTSG